MDLFKLYSDAGRTGVIAALAKLTVKELRNICKKNALDVGDTYLKYQENLELAKYMAYRVECMMEKGSAFI